MREKDAIKALNRRCRRLRREAVDLLNANSSLSLRKALLEGLCDILATVCQVKRTSHPTQEQRYQELQQEISLLLGLTAAGPFQEQTGQGFQSGLADGGALDAPDGATDGPEGLIRSAPRNDPLALYKQLVSQPLPEAETVTAAELAGLMHNAVLLGAIKLHQMRSGVPVVYTYAQAQADLQDVWQRYLRMTMSVALVGRPHVLMELSVYDLERLQPDPDGVAADTDRLPSLPPLLSLTKQQLQDIAGGTALFTDLLQKVYTEQHTLQAASSERSSAGPSTACGCFSRASEQLEAQQGSAERMQVLLRKDSALRVAACAWFIGCLSWEQFTTASILCWPYPTRIPSLAR